MRTLPHSREAYQLLHDGAIALAEVERDGIRVDTDYLERASTRIKIRAKHLRHEILQSEVAGIWRKTFGQRTNLGSGEQLGHVLFDKMGFDCPNSTPGGKPKTDEETLGTVDHPFVKDYLQIKKLEKCLNTYLKGITREVVDGFVHGFFNLHIPRTYRSSADSPNLQNMPIRDPEYSRMIRRAFIPRQGRRLVELDYSGIEVAISACYHKDPTMMKYLEDPSKDMHRDAAMECFGLSLKEMTATKKLGHRDKSRIKDIRYVGKNRFVFPQFYGDWYIDCARNLWDAIRTMDLRVRDGRSLYDHLRQLGIQELGDLDPQSKPRQGTMEKHVRGVEKDWWGKRFPVYAQWKQDWVKKYHRQGWLQMLTGFICQGAMSRNEIINYPVQGTAFHCLLRSLIVLKKEIKKQRMKSVVVGQIHDSILSDVVEKELEDFLTMAHEVMVDQLKAAWSWIIVPVKIEAEVTPVDGNWYEKRGMTIVT